MTVKTTSEVLREAADLIEPEGAWTQGEYARDSQGNCTEAMSPDASCWCLSGALIRVAGDYSASQDARDCVVDLIDWTIPFWNDHDHRTQAEVVAALRAAADRAEASA